MKITLYHPSAHALAISKSGAFSLERDGIDDPAGGTGIVFTETPWSGLLSVQASFAVALDELDSSEIFAYAMVLAGERIGFLLPLELANGARFRIVFLGALYTGL